LQQQTAGRWLVTLAQNVIVRIEISDRVAHCGEELQIVLRQLRNARQSVGKFCKRETMLHSCSLLLRKTIESFTLRPAPKAGIAAHSKEALTGQ
jgi:hypothetical protein